MNSTTEHHAETASPQVAIPAPVWVWGVPYTPLTTPQAVDLVDALIHARQPSFFITANLQYTMLTRQHPDLPAVNHQAAFIVADGMPLVWASRYKGQRLPERITGADLMFHLAQRRRAWPPLLLPRRRARCRPGCRRKPPARATQASRSSASNPPTSTP